MFNDDFFLLLVRERIVILQIVKIALIIVKNGLYKLFLYIYLVYIQHN